MNRLEIDHAASTHSSRRGHSEIINFELHSECSRQLDSLTIGKTQHFVIVEHSVHVLNPKSIYRTIKNNPLLVVSGVRHIGAHNRSYDTVSPLVGEHVGVPEELVHCHGFGIQTLLLHSFMIIVS